MADGLWISLGSPPGGGTHMLVRKNNGRWEVKKVYVHGSEITATAMQSVPVSQLRIQFNLYLAGPGGHLMAEHPLLGKLAVTPETDIKSLDDLEAVAERAPQQFAAPDLPERAKLTRPDGTDPDGFYRGVAAAYTEYAWHSRSPAVKIAEEAGVPVATARSWVREARRRGHLQAGSRGAAG